MKVLFVIPAFNEEAALPALLENLRQCAQKAGWNYQALVVDDGSSDGSAKVARAAGVRVLRLCRNLGIGGAVQAGLKVAQREGFDFAFQLDGDGQHPPSEAAKFLACAASDPPPDLVLGSRYLNKNGFRSTALRRLGGRFLSALLRTVTGLRVTDPTSGYRLYGKRALRLFCQNYPYDYPEPEALAMARAAQLEVQEISVAMQERQGGRSSIFGLNAPYYMLKVSLAAVLSYVRTRLQNRRQDGV